MAEGQTLDLNCVVPGQAHAQVTWHKRGGSLPVRHQVQAWRVDRPRRVRERGCREWRSGVGERGSSDGEAPDPAAQVMLRTQTL